MHWTVVLWGAFMMVGVGGESFDPLMIPVLERLEVKDMECPKSCSAEDVMAACMILNGMNGRAAPKQGGCVEAGGNVEQFSCGCNDDPSAGFVGFRRDINGTCAHTGGHFTPSPPFNPQGAVCTAQTGSCKRIAKESCGDAFPIFCAAQGGFNYVCSNNIATCDLCVGGALTVNISSSEPSCQKFNWHIGCSDNTDYQGCNGHGCCIPGGGCQCFSGERRGYWTGYTCSQCDSGWKGENCTNSRLSLTLIFGGEPSARPAVIPFLSIIWIYMCFAGCRKKWSHDQPYSAEQIKRLSQFSLSTEAKLISLRDYSEKGPLYIPPRNTLSKGLKNRQATRAQE
eukprot:TRINITY_DN26979_c0_g1_i1.p1 TRINITY_DN26979_c0_g1~~TRINITY_DN26979_c0_g1_i1.p1  ORF type:complete len:349 (+),score=38.02 TRINITY_DN26979_c0_g1_i1:30-1049(+)